MTYFQHVGFERGNDNRFPILIFCILTYARPIYSLYLSKVHRLFYRIKHAVNKYNQKCKILFYILYMIFHLNRNMVFGQYNRDLLVYGKENIIRSGLYKYKTCFYI
ncbi:ORF-110 [Teiidae poxvirus 1]|nr:ORF-110 [Teiidae poxvirus 1]